MISKKQIFTGIFAAVGMALLILDAKTALLGANNGITLCITTVIPSLFPFFVLSVLISSSLIGCRFSILRPICKACGMPDGSESLLLLGLTGGYPIGAQSIYEAYQSGQLSRQDATRLLGFCNNAGPAFLFGMVACLFENQAAVWVLWMIQILSVLITGFLLPDKSRAKCKISAKKPLTIPQALEKSVRNMALVCGWVILFRVISAILQRWCLWLLPSEIQVLIIGCLELTNGCTELHSITAEATRFLFSSLFLSMGGVCVGMQTISVCRDLGTGMYFPGKGLQSILSIFLSFLAQGILYADTSGIPWAMATACAGLCYALFLRRKKSAGNLAYNVV